MHIDLHCPVELLSWELLHDDRGNTRAYLTFGNLSAYRVSKLEVTLYCRTVRGDTAKQKLPVQAPDAAPRQPFSLSVPVKLPEGVVQLWPFFRRIFFEGIRRRYLGDESRICEIPDPHRPAGRALDKFRAVAGEDAWCYAAKYPDCWQCVCGRANPSRRSRCVRCKREAEQVLRRFTKAACQGGARTKRRLERENIRKQKSTLVRRSLFMALLVLVLLVLFLISRK